MAEGRNRMLWTHTSNLMAAIASTFGGKAARPGQFNPYAGGDGPIAQRAAPPAPVDVLKVFLAPEER